MADFNDAYNITMQYEGGYADNPADSGGETFKGIARNSNPNWSGWPIIDAIKASGTSNLNASLNQDTDLLNSIVEFYQANYWNVNSTGNINGQQLANQVFDTAVNCGTGTAAKYLQQAAGVTVDGQVGPQTLAAVNAADEATLYNAFIALRKQHYLNIIANNPSQQQFEHSWFSRMPAYQTDSVA